MWIVPESIISAYAPDTPVFLSDLNELSQACEQSLWWRSKPSPSRTWSQRWKRVRWMQHLSGRICPLSTERRFVAWWTSSLAATRARAFHLPVCEKEPTIPDTFGRLYEALFRQLNLFGASSKTSKDTSPWDTTTFTRTFELWATELRQDCLRRQRLALLTNGNGFSYWLTASIEENHNRKGASEKSGDGLSTAVKQWPTPQSFDATDLQRSPEALERAKQKGGCANLRERVLISGLPPTAPNSTTGSLPGLWMTPVANDDNKSVEAHLAMKQRMKGGPRKKITSLQVQIKEVSARQWRTPSDPTRRGGSQPEAKRRKGGHTVNLEDQIEHEGSNWPAPRVVMPTTMHQSANGGPPQNLRIEICGEKDARGKLSPRWVETLQGVPVGWAMPSCSKPQTPLLRARAIEIFVSFSPRLQTSLLQQIQE